MKKPLQIVDVEPSIVMDTIMSNYEERSTAFHNNDISNKFPNQARMQATDLSSSSVKFSHKYDYPRYLTNSFSMEEVLDENLQEGTV